MKLRTVFLVVLMLMLIPMSITFGQNSNDTIIRVELNGPQNFNPLLTVDGVSRRTQEVIWPYLIQLDLITGVPVSGAGLTSWTIGEDNRTYTFTIRDDANWSDGTPITASDVKFTFDASNSDQIESTTKGQTGQIESMRIVDDKTIEIVSRSPNCIFLTQIGSVPLLPAHRFQADFSDFASNPINTAPDISGNAYLFEEHKPDEYVRFKANLGYWGGEPKTPNLIIRVVKDGTITNQLLLAGEVDYAVVSPDQLDLLGTPDNLNIYSFPGASNYAFSMNWSDPSAPQPALVDGNPAEQKPHPIFSDVKVRQAVVMGIDHDSIIAAIGTGGGERLNSFVPSNVGWAFDETFEPLPYDTERAGALLDEAGWTLNESTGIREKDGQPLKIEFAFTGADTLYKTAALIAQDQLSRLGMDVALSELDGNAWLQKVLGQTYDMTVFSWGTQPTDWAPFMSVGSDVPGGGFNIASYINPKVEQLFSDAATVPGCDYADRGKLYMEIQTIIKEDVAYDFVLTTQVNHVVNQRVQNTNFGPWYSWYTDVANWTLGE